MRICTVKKQNNILKGADPMSNQNLNEILLDENIQLKTDLSIMRDENDYLQERNRNLQDELRISSLRHKEEIHKLQVQIAALESGEELADAYEYIEHQKAEIASLEEDMANPENSCDYELLASLGTKIEELRGQHDEAMLEWMELEEKI